MSAAGIIDTRETPGLAAGEEMPCASCASPPGSGRDGGGKAEGGAGEARDGRNWDGSCDSGSCLGQYYVQFRPGTTRHEKEAAESLAGSRLGRYFPDDAHILVATRPAAWRAASGPGVVWVGERPRIHKLERGLWPRVPGGGKNASGRSAWEAWEEKDSSSQTVYAMLVQREDRRGRSKEELSGGLEAALMAERGIEVEVRIASEDKIAVDAPGKDVRVMADYLASRWWVDWVERKGYFAPRNFAAQHMLVLGPKEVSLTSQAEFEAAIMGLDGSSQAVSIADTGLDFDHCMLWQESFPYPCFSASNWDVLEMQRCPASALAGMLGNPDFIDFVQSWNGTGGIPLLSTGRAAGASSVTASLDKSFTTPQQRQSEGAVLDLLDFLPLLRKWTTVRPTMIEVLRDIGNCADCGGDLVWDKGVKIFFERVPNAMRSFERTDKTADVTIDYVGPPDRVPDPNTPPDVQALMDFFPYKDMHILGAHLFEKCFCYFAKPSASTIDPSKSVLGPVPPIRELLLISRTPFSAVIRKENGLDALEPFLLDDLCNITKGGGKWPVPRPIRNQDGILTDICKVYEYVWAGQNYTWNTCRFNWDPRMLEQAIGSCLYTTRLSPENKVPPAVAPAVAFLQYFGPTSSIPIAQRKKIYTIQTVIDWWTEYTRVPPFEHVDTSRRRLKGYYTIPGCVSPPECLAPILAACRFFPWRRIA